MALVYDDKVKKVFTKFVTIQVLLSQLPKVELFRPHQYI